MTLLLRMAWRNLRRHARRTALTVSAIVFASFLISVQRGMAVGTWELSIRNMLEVFSGYLQIQRAGYQEHPSLAANFRYTDSMETSLRAIPGVTGCAPRVLADGLVSFRENSSGAAIVGVDPEREQTLSRFPQRVNAGRFITAGARDEAVLGYKLLQNLKGNVGDTLVILAQGADGVLGNERYRVVGTVKLGSPEFDAMAVFLDLGSAQELLAMEGRVHVVALGARSLRDVEPLASRLRGSLGADTRLAALTWEEVLPGIKEAMEFDRIGDWLFLGILVVIVGFSILNTVLMSVTERFREFGVSLAIGMQPRQLAVLVFIETLLIAAIGIVLGLGASQAALTYLHHHPIILTGEFSRIYEEYGLLPQITASNDPGVVLSVGAVMAVLSIVAMLYPIWKVLRLEPLGGIRYT